MDLGIITFLFVYVILPNLYYRSLSGKVIRRVITTEKVIVLTFDDGPDPQYTPELLEVLKQNDVKCTFFVLAEKALKHPDLIKKIINDGHYIGLHSLKHMNAILELPGQTKKDFSESIEIMNKLGVRIKLFRPPWGVFNPLTFHYAKVNNFKVILWSIHAMDWSRFTTVDKIRKRLISKVRPGDIILLHDGRGAKGAPKRTIRALETVLPVLKQQGYRFVLAKDI